MTLAGLFYCTAVMTVGSESSDAISLELSMADALIADAFALQDASPSTTDDDLEIDLTLSLHLGAGPERRHRNRGHPGAGGR